MARSRRPLPAVLVALGLLLAVTQPLPAQAAGPPSSAAARTAPAAVAALAATGSAVVARAPRPVKGISMQQLLPYWGANAPGVTSDLADAQAVGATWARVSLPYGAAATGQLARVVAAAKAHRVRLVVVLEKPAPLNDLGTAANRAVYRSWVVGTVRRFRASVKYWEIFNEPNLRSSWNIDNRLGSNQTVYAAAVRRYVALLVDGYRAVKAADPKAVVVFGGLSESTVERYLAVLLTTSAWRYFDVMSFHPFGRTPVKVMGRYNALKVRLNARSGWARKPIWVTEVGFNTSWTSKGGYVPNEKVKAAYLGDTVRRLFDATRRPVFWHNLHGADPAHPGFGLETKDKATLAVRRLPAFTTFRAL